MPDQIPPCPANIREIREARKQAMQAQLPRFLEKQLEEESGGLEVSVKCHVDVQ